MSDNNVVPSSLEEKTISVEEKVASGSSDESEQTECSLCSERIADIQLVCGHVICEPCLTSWRRTKTECPWCRAFPKSYLRIHPNIISAPSEEKECLMCYQLLNKNCVRCAAYTEADDAVPKFNPCNCVRMKDCNCAYHRHCIGFYYLHGGNTKCPACDH